MKERRDPRSLRTGDIVSPTLAPTVRVRIDHVGLSTVAAVMPQHIALYGARTPVRVLIGEVVDENLTGTGKPARVVLATHESVRLLRRPERP